MEKPLQLYKIILIGDGCVGKTGLSWRFCEGAFSLPYLATIGVDFKVRDVVIDGNLVKLQIWDTAGQERFRTLCRAFYRGSLGVLFVYDVTNEDSFSHIEDWIIAFDKNNDRDVQKILIGNKTDLMDQIVIHRHMGEELAQKYNMKFFETSAKMGWNVEDIFMTLAKDIKHCLETKALESPSSTKLKSKSSKDKNNEAIKLKRSSNKNSKSKQNKSFKCTYC